jgi:hypothetical protein
MRKVPAWILTAVIAICFAAALLGLFTLTHFQYTRVYSTYFFGLASIVGLLAKYTSPTFSRVLAGISAGCLILFVDIMFS